MEDNINHELYEKIEYITSVIGMQLNIPIRVVKQVFYIEMTMAECWNAEDGMTPNLHNVIFAERVLTTAE